MFLTRQVKLYPNKAQEAELNRILEASRICYNELMERKIKLYKKSKKNLSRFDLQKLVTKNKFKIPSTVAQGVCKRITFAYERFFKKTGKFPRFKSINRFRSIEVTNYGIGGDYIFKENKVRLWKPIKWIRMRGFSPQKNYRQGILIKRVSGWYLQYTFEVKEKPVKKRFSKKIGIDLGLTSFLTDSKGNKVKPPKFFKLSEQKLVKAQKAKRSVGRIYEHIANQRKDWLHKLSRQYANSYDLIAVENLNVEKMLKNTHFAKSISDASWSAFIHMLSYKLEMLGKRLVKVRPEFTSQKCSKCGELVSKSLSVRTHICPNCGYTADRDENAAKNILAIAQHGLRCASIGATRQNYFN